MPFSRFGQVCNTNKVGHNCLAESAGFKPFCCKSLYRIVSVVRAYDVAVAVSSLCIHITGILAYRLAEICSYSNCGLARLGPPVPADCAAVLHKVVAGQDLVRDFHINVKARAEGAAPRRMSTAAYFS